MPLPRGTPYLVHLDTAAFAPTAVVLTLKSASRGLVESCQKPSRYLPLIIRDELGHAEPVIDLFVLVPHVFLGRENALLAKVSEGRITTFRGDRIGLSDFQLHALPRLRNKQAGVLGRCTYSDILFTAGVSVESQKIYSVHDLLDPMDPRMQKLPDPEACSRMLRDTTVKCGLPAPVTYAMAAAFNRLAHYLERFYKHNQGVTFHELLSDSNTPRCNELLSDSNTPRCNELPQYLVSLFSRLQNPCGYPLSQPTPTVSEWSKYLPTGGATDNCNH
jgi:hypothetical protein